MIICACPTTTIERNWIIPNFSIGGFHRVQKELVFASGKGVNVARVINNLGGEVTCAGFVGGYSGLLFQSLIDAEGLRGAWTKISGDTRLSITVYDPQNIQDATSFCDYGPAATPDEWQDFSAGLQDLARDTQNISISGSIPPGVEPQQLFTLICELRRADKKVWLDLSGPRLAAGVNASPFAIKVNLKEISELIEQPVQTRSEIMQALTALRQAHQIAITIVTLGPEGAICSSDWGNWIIHPIHYPEVVSSIGSGDSFLGGLLVEYERGASLMECLRAASAAAAANTQRLGPGIFSTEDYQQAMERTVVECTSV
jgi:1-phosphofructokinase family hexose kinase